MVHGPQFPLDALRSGLNKFVEEEIVALQVQPDLSGVLALRAPSAVVTGRATVQAERRWKEPLNLYTVAALGSGEGQSLAYRDAIAMLPRPDRWYLCL